MPTNFRAALIGSSLLLLPVLIGASEQHDGKANQAIGGIMPSYLVIQNSLSNDSLSEVSGSAKKILAEADKLSSPRDKKSLEDSARALAKAKDLKSARDAFKALSSTVIPWARKAKPAGVQEYFCSMADASWLQSSGETANPYYGKEMRGCGEVKSGN
ncbi:MAG: hypothetical protein A2428_17015 [Bdellovibrionales bacterium RIFOXYC1_FULL_54_43]|nr:MAG: hypothetical protein A2428_17015 [Bdellovibrionales bacterium RIFOXYC1_FULL_54_43]OFZ80267.1 MAG: hypothetical protein A2603_03635 [Bdellovibrionales bacterium RIFOXYD1_FULL_55_31]